jgi:hypothetical protein
MTQPVDVKNYLVPAFGAIQCVPIVLPGASALGAYGVDFRTILIDDQPFQPQGVTVDATNVPVGQTVTFTVTAINFNRVIAGGNSETFNFPAIITPQITITPSDLSSTVRAFFYNFPALPDATGTQAVSITGTSGTQSVSVAEVSSFGSEATTLPTSLTTTAGVLVATSSSETIKLYSIDVICNNTSGLASTLVFVSDSIATAREYAACPINLTAATFAHHIVFNPPLLLALGADLLYDATVATTLTNPPVIVARYAIV